MRIVALLVGAGVVSAASCSRATGPMTQRDGSAVIFGTITSTSGIVVPEATVIVRFYADSTRVYSVLQCAGAPLATASEPLDGAGAYRLEVTVPGAAGRRVCVDVTGDPHGLYSDIGLKRQYAGWIELSPAAADAAPLELRVDVRYTETP